MNRLHKLSIFANILLAVVVLWLVQRMYRTAEAPPASAANEVTNTQPAAPSVPSVPPEPVPAAAASFRWSQLQSTNDYRVYLSNLRAIGCPERIIRAIVQMDVGDAYAFKRKQLGLDGTETGPWSRLAEANMVAKLMGDPLPVADAAAATQATNPPGSSQQDKPSWYNNRAPTFPVVFQPVDPNVLPLTDSQRQTIEQLKQRFINEIGGLNQDPNDPAYLARWQKAQSEINDMLRGYLGRQFYMNYQQAARAAATAP